MSRYLHRYAVFLSRCAGFSWFWSNSRKSLMNYVLTMMFYIWIIIPSPWFTTATEALLSLIIII